jgi:transposase
MKGATACQPLLNLLQDELLSGFYVHADETTLQVLAEPGRSPTTKSYMWVFGRGDPDRPILIFQYNETRSSDVASAFLRGFKGYVQTDGYAGYDFLDKWEDVRHMGCMAHARRKFTDIIKAQGKNRKKNGSVDIALSYINKLYRLEKEAREKGCSPQEIYEMRQERAKPVMDQFHAWLLKRAPQVLPKSLLGKAISYCLAQWNRLVVYLEDGRLSIDNNAAENAIRPFVLGRKNWLFAGTPGGAEASASLYSLLETAKANGQEPYSYLRYIFAKLPYATTLSEYEALLPWNVDPQKLARKVLDTGI